MKIEVELSKNGFSDGIAHIEAAVSKVISSNSPQAKKVLINDQFEIVQKGGFK